VIVVPQLKSIYFSKEKSSVEIEKNLKKKDAAALLKEIAKALESDAAQSIKVDNKLTIELPKKMDISLEYEVEGDDTELEIEFNWSTAKRSRTGKFEVYTGGDGQSYFRLKAPNGEVILASEGYQKRKGALSGIESVKKNAQPEQFEVRESKAGQPYFVLKAKNNQVIGTSQMYKRQASCKKGVKSVIKTAPKAEVDTGQRE
jgi:amphi-Trp domain-containing protein